MPAAAPRLDLTDGCERCAGLCCAALGFAKSADFAASKPAGTPCANLDAGFRCTVHSRLVDVGYRGCVTYSCFGAGPRLTGALAGGDWTTDPAGGREVFAALPRGREVGELLWHLYAALDYAALDRPVTPRTRADLQVARERTERIAQLPPAQLLDFDLPGHRDEVVALLRECSRQLRSPKPGPDLTGADLVGARLSGAGLRRASLRGARLVGADLRRADLRAADLTGADLRGADLRGTDLCEVLFLNPAQVRSARGSVDTRLPADLPRPEQWGPTEG